MYKDFGTYPDNSKFDAFQVSYEEDLAEMITDKKFIYTNNTKSTPSSPATLEEIAGTGNSSLITYEGTGAYFLDKIESGVWRLEVMPDAIWIEDPFGRNSLSQKVAVVNWRTWPMTVNLPDLGSVFSIRALNDNNTFAAKVQGQSFSITPGTYLITRNGIDSEITGDRKWKNIILKEFTAPPANVEAIHVVHSPRRQISESKSHIAEAIIVSKKEPVAVELSLTAGFRPKVFQMKKVSGYKYAVNIPAEDVKEGFLRYFISVTGEEETVTFPGARQGSPANWDFDNQHAYEVSVVPGSAPIYIFNAASDNDELSRPWNKGSAFVPASEPGKAEVRINIEKLFALDSENPQAAQIHDYSMRYYFGNKIKGREYDVDQKKELVFRGRSMSSKPCWVQLALVSTNGQAYGGVVKINNSVEEYQLSLSDLKPVKLVTLPRPYPTFLSYYFEGDMKDEMDLKTIETLQISIGPGVPQSELENSHALAIESIRLE
jgi:hypothetical protein